MDKAFECLNAYYETHNEDARLTNRRGRVEFLTTIRYIEKYLESGMKILEIGAGTGRYSHYFARAGYEVDAVKLIPHNIEVFRENTQPGEKITVAQGNATDLSAYPDNTYDITLLFGPMYHLYTEEDQKQALAEAVRVTKPNGILFVAYCMNEAAIIQYEFIKGNILHDIDCNLLNTDTFRLYTPPENLFALHRIENIVAMMEPLPVTRLHLVGTDLFTRYISGTVDAMSDEVYELYLRYHFAVCERTDLIGISNHTLDVLRKNA